jgi:hypothetical protein
MIIRDNRGKIIGQIEHLGDNNGNSFDSNTIHSNERPVIQLVSVRDNQGHVESKTILNGKLLP